MKALFSFVVVLVLAMPSVGGIGGAVLGFVPGLPPVQVDPEVVLVVFLPPLLYRASIFANFNDLRASLRGLALTTVGLVEADDATKAKSARTAMLASRTNTLLSIPMLYAMTTFQSLPA